MEIVLNRYKHILCENNYVSKLVTYIKKNKLMIILFFIFPLFLSTILKAIFEVNFGSSLEMIFNSIKSITWTTIKDDIQFILILIFTAELKLEYRIIFSLQLILYSITGKMNRTFIILTVFWGVLVSVNHFVYQLRGAPLAITDFLAITTAFNVIKGYTLKITWKYIISILILIIFIIFIFLIDKNENKIRNIFVKIVLGTIGVLCFITVKNNSIFEIMNIWNLTESYSVYGQVTTFLKTSQNIIVEKPQNYSEQKAKDILNSYKLNENRSEELPNVMVVMNETFSDLKDTYNLEMEENLSFIKSLEENTISGTVYTSVLGGKTSTAEWEFLTGNSSGLIPYGAIPYIQYIQEPKESLVSIFNDLDYETIGFHSYDATGYNREVVYRNLQFENVYFKNDMIYEEPTGHKYTSDNCTYQNFFEFTKNIKNKKFGFIVTMQNHSPYTNRYEEIKNYISREKINYTGKDELDEYLNLINMSDEALKNLIEQLKNSDEKTILLFFGDHQPGLVIDLPELFQEKEWMQNYQVPFVIWANYDIEEQKEVEISTNYLSILLANTINMPKSEYMNFLNEVQQEIPIITGNGYKGADGNIYEINDVASPYYDLINQYQILQYYQMFDKVLEEK